MCQVKKILVTGGAGFIGCNFIHLLRQERPDWQIVCLDSLTYAGNLENLKSCLDEANFEFVKGDICDEKIVGEILSGGVDVVVNFAAESHVDRKYPPTKFTVRWGRQVIFARQLPSLPIVLTAHRRPVPTCWFVLTMRPTVLQPS